MDEIFLNISNRRARLTQDDTESLVKNPERQF